MTKSLSATNNGFARLFSFLIELVHMLHGSPVGNVPVFAFPKEPIQHAATREKANVSLVQWRYGPAAHLLLFADQHAASVLHCNRACNRSSISSSGKPV